MPLQPISEDPIDKGNSEFISLKAPYLLRIEKVLLILISFASLLIHH